MKKAFAILLTMVLVFGLSVPAFAAKSPNGTEYHQVVIIQGNGHKENNVAPEEADNITFTTVVSGNSVTVKADPAMGEFTGWVFYKADGSVAVEGVDYKVLGAATMSSTEIEFIPLTTIVVAANYNNVTTETIIIEENEEDVAPETGDNMVVALSAVAMIALCGAVVAKKQLAK